MGDLKLNGSTSGTITVTPTAVAGTNTITLPASTGTVALTASPTFSGTLTATTITSPASTALTIQSAGTTAMTVSTSQYVGVGTTSPQSALSIKGAFQGSPTGGDGIQLGATGGYAVIEMSGTTGGFIDFNKGDGTDFLGRIIYNNTSNYMSFQTNIVEAARINSSGNLLVGTTSTFDVTSGAITQLSGQCAVYNSGGSSPNTIMSFYNATQSARVGYIGSSGNSTSYNSGSDYRLKENVANINGALSTISAMRPVTFTWKISPEAGAVSGFIAHELQEIFPEAVGGEKDAMCDDGVTPNYQMVDQSKLVPLLVAAIQELSAKNDALEARLAALEAK